MCRKVVIAVILTICVLGLGMCLYIALFYTRTPEYIHQNITPPYEKAATEFFENNYDSLCELTKALEEVDTNCYYYYAFQEHEFNSTDIPNHLLKVMEALESSTSNKYVVSIQGGEIKIYFKSSTYFDVYLCYEYPVTEYITEDEWSKTTPLKNGWRVEAPYILRG